MSATYSDQFAAFCHDIQFEQLPKNVIDQTKYFFLDYLGIAIRAAHIDSSKPIHAVIDEMPAIGQSTIIGKAQTTASCWAALANGTAAHSLELDDTFLEGSIHNECFIYASALAEAEALASNGQQFIVATVLGFDIACRLAKALQPAIANARGFHPTGICGSLGATITSGKLLTLSQEQFVLAIGIAASQASGLLEYVTNGAWTKRLHAGWAAHAGIIAAHLAKNHFQGPRTAIEGKFGFLHAYSGNPKLEDLVAGLGTDYKILKTAIKFYPCVYYIQAAIDAMLLIVKEQHLTPEQIKSITVHTLTAGFNLVCQPVSKKRQPISILDAQFSMHFNIAIALLQNRVTLAEYHNEYFFSAKVRAIMEKVHCEIDPALDALYPVAWPARVHIITNDNASHSAEVQFAKGAPQNPLSWDELIIKHKNLVNGYLNDDDDNQLIAFVRNLENQSNFNKLSQILKQVNNACN